MLSPLYGLRLLIQKIQQIAFSYHKLNVMMGPKVIFLIIAAGLGTSWACCNTNSCTSNCCSNCQQQCTSAQCVSTCQSNCCQASCQTQQSCTNCKQQSCTNCQQQTCNNCKETEPTKTVVVPSAQIGQTKSSRSGSVKADVSSTNIIHNNNVINMTIGVNSKVENNIHNGGSSKSKDTVPYVPIVVPASSTSPRPYPMQPRQGCCIIVQPCVSQGCNSYHHRCEGCSSSFGYAAINPCYGGCSRRSSWERTSCSFGSCNTGTVDCNECGEDFYQTFEGYSKCQGCFYN